MTNLAYPKITLQPLTSLVRRAMLCAAAALAVGCATVQPTAESIVMERAQQRWDALVASRFEAVYQFTPPSYRELVNLGQHTRRLASAPAAFVNAKVKSAVCEADTKCNVVVEVEYQPLIARGFDGTLTKNIDEVWVSSGGQWWFQQKI